MILSIVAILVVGLIAYLWAAQGLFSALLHFLCVLVAGAVAFAVWEPLTYTFLLGAQRDIAWCIGLMAPFLVTLLLLRIAVDKLIPSNLDFDGATNFVGGLVFGALSGVVTAGVLVLALSHLRMPPALFGYQPVAYDTNGNLVRKSGLLLPVDSLTIKLYEALSAGAFSTDTPLASRIPQAHEAAALTRFTYADKGISAIKPEDFDIVGSYKIEGPELKALLSDSFTLNKDGEPVPQTAKMIDGAAYPAGSRLEGYLVRFKAGAKEKSGQIIISPGQFRLVVSREGKAIGLQPIAAIGRAEAFSFNLGRWRFDNSEPYYSSVGGASDATFALEFIVPKDAAPERDFYVKLTRAKLPGAAPIAFASTTERDDAIRAHSGAFEALATGAVAEAPAPSAPGQPAAYQQEPIRVSDRLPAALNRSDLTGLELEGKENFIANGEATLNTKQVGTQGIDFALRVDRFASTADTTIVQVDVSVNSRVTLFGRALDAALNVAPPVLIDNLGQQYEAIGYIHDTGSEFAIRFTPGKPLRGLTEIPTLSRSRPAEKLILVFRPSCNVQIVKFAIGNKVIEEMSPPLQMPAPRPQRR